MRTYFDCIPCFVRQSLDAVRLVSDDKTLHELVLREVLKMLSRMDLKQSPPAMAQQIHRLIRRVAGYDDPYRRIKERSNHFSLELYQTLKGWIEESDKPLETAVRLAIAGNVIDYGVYTPVVNCPPLLETIERSLEAPLDAKTLDIFSTAVETASTILYLGDNAGEIVFDQLLIEQMPHLKITYVVKGHSVLNDVTFVDALTTGLTNLVEVVDNGSDAPGTVLDTCSDSFRERFEQADLVIAKGQANFESLSDEPKDIFFLFQVKCPVIARKLGNEIGSLVLRRSNFVGMDTEEGARYATI